MPKLRIDMSEYMERHSRYTEQMNTLYRTDRSAYLRHRCSNLIELTYLIDELILQLQMNSANVAWKGDIEANRMLERELRALRQTLLNNGILTLKEENETYTLSFAQSCIYVVLQTINADGGASDPDANGTMTFTPEYTLKSAIYHYPVPIKLSDWADARGIKKNTVRQWASRNKIPTESNSKGVCINPYWPSPAVSTNAGDTPFTEMPALVQQPTVIIPKWDDRGIAASSHLNVTLTGDNALNDVAPEISINCVCDGTPVAIHAKLSTLFRFSQLDTFAGLSGFDSDTREPIDGAHRRMNTAIGRLLPWDRLAMSISSIDIGDDGGKTISDGGRERLVSVLRCLRPILHSAGCQPPNLVAITVQPDDDRLLNLICTAGYHDSGPLWPQDAASPVLLYAYLMDE